MFLNWETKTLSHNLTVFRLHRRQIGANRSNAAVRLRTVQSATNFPDIRPLYHRFLVPLLSLLGGNINYRVINLSRTLVPNWVAVDSRRGLLPVYVKPKNSIAAVPLLSELPVECGAPEKGEKNTLQAREDVIFFSGHCTVLNYSLADAGTFSDS